MPRGSLLGRLTPTRAKNRLTFAADPAEFIVELLHAACAVHKTLFPGISRMRIGGYILHDHVILNAVNRFLFLGLHGGTGQEFFS